MGAGMGDLPTADDWAAYYASQSKPPPTEETKKATEKSLTSMIFGAIDSVANVFTGRSAAQIEEDKRKAAEIVANATNRVAGGYQPPTPSPGSPYTLPLAIGGGALVIGTLVYFATRTSSPRRRR
jgi:hypothetical protein